MAKSKTKAVKAKSAAKPQKKVKKEAKKIAKKVSAKPAKVAAKKVIEKPAAKKPAKGMVKSALKKATELVKKVAKVAAPKETAKPLKMQEKVTSKAAAKADKVKAKLEPKIEVEEEFFEEKIEETVEEVVLTDAEGRRYCRVRDCDQLANVDAYCRYHYLLHWKKIQVRKKILTEGKLERYIEELTARYPDKYLEMIKKDLKTEKDFLAAIQELEIDESVNEAEFEEDSEGFIDEVRGMGTESTGARDEEEF